MGALLLFPAVGNAKARSCVGAVDRPTAYWPHACSWKPRKGTDLRFLVCPVNTSDAYPGVKPGIQGPVSETFGEFGGTKNFKPWIFVRHVGKDWADVSVARPGVWNTEEGALGDEWFLATIPIVLLPIDAQHGDSFAVDVDWMDVAHEYKTDGK